TCRGESIPRRVLDVNCKVKSTGGRCGLQCCDLEVQLQPELHNARIEGRGELAEVAGGERVADLVELGVIPGVERLGAELQTAATSFAEDEALEQGDVPVVAAGATRYVVAQVSEGTNGRFRERTRID